MRPKGYFWNDERDQTIRDIFLGSTALSTSQIDRLIAEKLGTTASAVATRRSALGVKSADPNAHRGRPAKTASILEEVATIYKYGGTPEHIHIVGYGDIDLKDASAEDRQAVKSLLKGEAV